MAWWRNGVAVVLAALGLCLAFGAGAADLQEGRDFRELNPPLAPAKGKIEVTEFFWYGCPHCFDFEHVLTPWARKLPADV
ncbi:MAG: thiol:disulfide interchange protein, partial [Sulfuritalea sp.]|nr:thiol:disulfide interchange protein [Sulfuritalea sp.]